MRSLSIARDAVVKTWFVLGGLTALLISRKFPRRKGEKFENWRVMMIVTLLLGFIALALTPFQNLTT